MIAYYKVTIPDVQYILPEVLKTGLDYTINKMSGNNFYIEVEEVTEEIEEYKKEQND